MASVVDLRGVPRMFRRFAEGAVKKAYQQAAGALPQGLSPAEYVIILPDWDGAVHKAVGLEGTDKQAGVDGMTVDFPHLLLEALGRSE